MDTEEFLQQHEWFLENSMGIGVNQLFPGRVAPYARTQESMFTQGMIELYNQTFPKGQKNIYIQYKAGYSTSGIQYPLDLKQVALEMVAKKFKDSEESRFGVVSKNVMGENIQFSYTDLTKEQRNILNRYRKSAAIKGIKLASGYSSNV